MSHILIGIVAITLFVAIALAATHFIGGKFYAVAAEGQATAAVQQLQQVAQAVEMYRMKTGIADIPNQGTAFLVPRFLEGVARNTVPLADAHPGVYLYSIHLNDDIDPDETDQAGTKKAAYVMMVVGDNDAKICQAIADQTSGGVIRTDRVPTQRNGCNKVAGRWYMAYHHI